MANLIVKKIKNEQAKIKAMADENKKLVSGQKNQLKSEQPKETQPKNIEIVKEPQTLMLDVN